MATTTEKARPRTEPAWLLGIPFAPMTQADVIAEAERRIDEGTPSYFVTANLNYAMLCSRDPELAEVNRRAAFVLADGMPLLWLSRWKHLNLPERVAGADLIFALSEMAAEHGYRVFLLGAAPGVAEQAARNLQERYPGLIVAGTESPPFRDLSEAEERAMIERIRSTRPDLLFAAFGQPRGEKWVHDHIEALGVPVAAQLGASIDFAAGVVRRAPAWMQRTGLEWLHRFLQEPRRLGRRYLGNGLFFLGALLRPGRVASPARAHPGSHGP